MTVTKYYMSESDLVFHRTPVFPITENITAMPCFKLSEVPSASPFRGFGVALTGSSCYRLSEMDADKRASLLADVYGKDGANLSVARVSVGSSDYSAELYSYDDTPNDTSLAHFSTARDDAYVLPMIREVLSVRPDLYVFASPWSPPGWMKTGSLLCGGFMREEYLAVYAEYLARFLLEYREKGVDIAAMTLQNEPYTQQFGKMPACIWHPDIMAKFVPMADAAFRKAGLHPEIWLHDHDYGYYQTVAWMLDTCPALSEVTKNIAFHYYEGGAADIDGIREAHPDMHCHFTEAGPRTYDHYTDDLVKWGSVIADALSHGCESFTGWNLLLDERGDPNVGPFYCGGLITENSASGELTYSGQYRAFRLIAPYLRRGAKRLDVSGGTRGVCYSYAHSADLRTYAARNIDGSVCVIAVNPGNDKRQSQIEYNGGRWYFDVHPKTLAVLYLEP